MATVYRAYQPSLARTVAVKVLPEDFANDPGFKQRFQQEAIAVANLRHPNIPTVYEYGDADGIAYIVTDYIEGGTLADRLGGPVQMDYAIHTLGAVANALDYAHSKGVLHRDVKPSNVLLERDGTPILADFGLAKMTESDTSHLTRTGTIVGTPEYMSPEQCEGHPLTPAADQYALGVVAFEMLTGKLPFVGPTPLAVVLAQVREPVPPARSLNPNLPIAVEEVLGRALSKQPEERYSTCAEFVSGLAVALQGAPMAPNTGIETKQPDPPARPEPVSADQVHETSRTAAAPETSVTAEPAALPPAREATRRHRTLLDVRLGARSRWVAASAVVLMLLAGGGYGASRANQLFPNLTLNRGLSSPSPTLQVSPTPVRGSSPSPSASPSPSPSLPPVPAMTATKIGETGFNWHLSGTHFTPSKCVNVSLYDPASATTPWTTWPCQWYNTYVRSDGTWSEAVGIPATLPYRGARLTACDASNKCASVAINLY